MNVNKILKIKPEETALVLIDLQIGITSMMSEPSTPAEVIANAQKLTKAFHEAKMQVCLVHVNGSADGKDMLHPETDEKMQWGGERPKNWSEIVPELSLKENDLLITKRQWGAFYGTELDLELRRREIKTIVLGGISTNYGVESTARDAYERGYSLIFAEDAMAARAKSDHEFAIARIFPRIGRVRKTAEIISALQK